MKEIDLAGRPVAGQIMSTRPDMFPPEFLGPLIELQDRVPPFRFADVRFVNYYMATGMGREVARALFEHAESRRTFATTTPTSATSSTSSPGS